MIDRRSWGRAWHGATVLVIALSLIVQLAIVFSGRGAILDAAGLIAALPVRLLRFFSYFTIQSNLLAAGTALSLMQRPDRDGRLWRVLRADAIVGMTVTFVVYVFVLRPIVHLEGVAKLSDIGFHYVAPALTVIGWFVFGPWPRIDRTTLLRHLAWPVGYFAYVLVLGAISGWYPYPFITASKLGYTRALLNGMLAITLLLAVASVYGVLDSHRDNSQAQPL